MAAAHVHPVCAACLNFSSRDLSLLPGPARAVPFSCQARGAARGKSSQSPALGGKAGQLVGPSGKGECVLPSCPLANKLLLILLIDSFEKIRTLVTNQMPKAVLIHSRNPTYTHRAAAAGATTCLRSRWPLSAPMTYFSLGLTGRLNGVWWGCPVCPCGGGALSAISGGIVVSLGVHLERRWGLAPGLPLPFPPEWLLRVVRALGVVRGNHPNVHSGPVK